MKIKELQVNIDLILEKINEITTLSKSKINGLINEIIRYYSF